MLIATGHTSYQAPHSDDAYGSDASTGEPTPRSCGDRIAPIGPGYGEPYAWPPARSYTGHTLRHAEHRMHRSACRPTLSASVAVRPLSSSTRWNSAGPSPGATPDQIVVYGFIRSAVELRGSSARNTSRSRQDGSTFSTPTTEISTRGRVRHMR